jgi:hypothetical protein
MKITIKFSCFEKVCESLSHFVLCHDVFVGTMQIASSKRVKTGWATSVVNVPDKYSLDIAGVLLDVWVEKTLDAIHLATMVTLTSLFVQVLLQVVHKPHSAHNMRFYLIYPTMRKQMREGRGGAGRGEGQKT